MAFLTLALAVGAADAPAQEIEPRAFSNIPIGVEFLIAGYGYAEGGLVTDPALPLRNANLRTHTTVFTYARSLDIWGQSVYASTGLSTRIGSDADTLGIAWQYRWGGGL